MSAQNLFMKQTLILVTLLLGFLGTGFSQSETGTKTGTKTEARNEHQDHMLIDFGWETFTNKPNGVEYKWYNNGLNIQLFYDQLIGQTGLSAAIGVGFSTQSYYSNRQIRRDSTQPGLYSNWVTPDYVPYQSNKVSTSWVDIPVELRYRSKVDDWGYRWKFAVGIKTGFLFDTHDKIVSNDNIKYKTYYFPDVNNLRFGLTARAGYGKINFSAFFSFTEFFYPGRGPEMKQLGFGISLVPF